MNETGTGLFPNGPAQQMARDRDAIINKLITALMSGRHRESWSDEWKDALALVLGPPHTCLICGARWGKSNVADLDDWFCSKHCPVCSSWEAVLS